MSSLAHSPFLQASYSLTPRPQPIPGNMRRARRVALLLLATDHCRQATASLEQLHVLNWALRTSDARIALLDFLRGHVRPEIALLRYDPVLPRILAYAESARLLERLRGADARSRAQPPQVRYRLTDAGRAHLAALAGDPLCLIAEREFLSSIGRRLTQTDLRPLFRWSM
jgi:hypothetical protein